MIVRKQINKDGEWVEIWKPFKVIGYPHFNRDETIK